jgi:hypothetical protein
MTAVTRFGASRRIVGFLVAIYDRLRRRDFISPPTFNLPLTQEQLGDHLGLISTALSGRCVTRKWSSFAIRS